MKAGMKAVVKAQTQIWDANMERSSGISLDGTFDRSDPGKNCGPVFHSIFRAFLVISRVSQVGTGKESRTNF